MRKLVAIALFILLLCHALGYGLAALSSWWLDQTILMERLAVYRTTDSLIEFQLPLTNPSDDLRAISQTTADGFTYNRHYYDVVSLEVRNDTLFMAAIDLKRHPFWQADLLSFLSDHRATPVDAHKKVNQVLKLLLQEYDPPARSTFRFLVSLGAQAAPPVSGGVGLLTPSQLVNSPPPETTRSFSLVN